MTNTSPAAMPMSRESATPAIPSGDTPRESAWRLVRQFLGYGGLVSVSATLVCIAWIDLPLAKYVNSVGVDQHLWMRRFLDIPIVVSPLALLYVLVHIARPTTRHTLLGRKLYIVSVAMLVALQVKTLLKILFGRTWPRAVEDVVVGTHPGADAAAQSTGYINDGIHTFNFFGGSAKLYAAFPSGSTTVLLAALVPLGFVFPRARPTLAALGLVSLCAYVLTNTHFVGDVLFGAFVGTCCGLVAVAHIKELK